MTHAPIKFKGWDWTELLAIWPKHPKWPKDTVDAPYAEEEAQGAWLNRQIADLFSAEGRSALESWQYRQVIRYLKKCAAVSPHTGKRIMEAIANEPDDYARLSWIGDIRGWWS